MSASHVRRDVAAVSARPSCDADCAHPFRPDALPRALNSTVYVHIHYTELSGGVADGLVRLFGLY